MPAAIRIAAPIAGVTVRSPEINVVRCKASWISVAAALKKVHAAMYPATNIAIFALAPAPRGRTARAYIVIIGLALGTIIAIIITLHITNAVTASPSDHGCG